MHPLLAALVFLPPVDRPTPRVPNGRYVSQGFALAATFEPARFHKAAKAAGLPVDGWWEQTRKQTGVDLARVERVTGLHEPLLNWSVLGMGAVALRYPQGVDRRAKLAEILGDDAVKTTAGDHTYYRSKKYRFLDQADLEVAGFAGEDVVLSVWPMLENMLGVPWDDKRFAGDFDRRLARNYAFGGMAEPTGKPGPLARVLADVDTDHDLVLVLAPGPVLDKLVKMKDWTDPPPGLPKDYLPAWRGLKRTTAVVAFIDFAAAEFLRVEFRTGDAEAAGVVEEGLRLLLAKAREGFPEAQKELLADIPQEMRTPILAVLGEAVTAPTLARRGSTVVLTIKKPEGLVYR